MAEERTWENLPPGSSSCSRSREVPGAFSTQTSVADQNEATLCIFKTAMHLADGVHVAKKIGSLECSLQRSESSDECNSFLIKQDALPV
jgi:hypothetical protein